MVQFNNQYCLVLRLECRDVRLHLVNCYFRYHDPIGEHLDHLNNVFRQLQGESVLICADVNAKSTLWHNPHTDMRGEEVEEFLLTHDLTVVNARSPYTTFESAQGTSNIDVTLCSQRLRLRLHSWTIAPDTLLSDHRLITFDLSMGLRPPVAQHQPLTGHIRLQDVDWRIFDATLLVDTAQAEWFDEYPLDEKVSKLTLILQKAGQESVPPRKRPRATARWWTKELDAARASKLARERRWKYLRRRRGDDDPRTVEARAQFTQARTQYINKIRHTKKAAWQACIQLGNDGDPWGTAYKILTSRYKALPPLVSLRIAQQDLHSPHEIVTHMLQGLLPDDSPETDTAWHAQITLEASSRMAGPVPYLEEMDVRLAVFDQKNGKAPGDDGIRPEIIKRAYQRLKLFLVDTIRSIWLQGDFPVSWNHGNVKLFLKSPDRDRMNIKSYRPVTLLPVLRKIVERLICQRLVMFLDATHYFGNNQYGFRAGRGTVDAMLALRQYVTSSDARYVMGIFIDISGAFDNAWWPYILWRLRESGCPSDVYNLIQSYLAGRTASLTWDGVTARKTLTKGCPQGSILGPILWNIVFETFLRQDFGEGVRIIAYADDTVVVIPGMSRLELEQRSEVVMQIMHVWSAVTQS